MRPDPRGWLVRHWPIKIAALLLSLLLWLVVAARRPTTQIRPVDLQLEPPRGRAFTRPIPNVTALVSGTAHGLLDLYGKPLQIHKVLPDTITDSRIVVQLLPRDVIVPPDARVSVQDVQPREITVSLDEVARRSVPVVPRVDIRPDSGYVVTGGVALLPAQVEIAGPRLQVENTASVSTVAIEIRGAREPVRRRVPLDTTATGGLRVTPSVVEIAAEIVPLSERRFTTLPIVVRDGRWSTDPPTVDLLVRGPASRVLALAPDSFTVSIAPAATVAPGDSVSLVVEAPPGVSAVPVPAMVVLRRRSR